MDAAQLTQWRDTLLKARANPRQRVRAPDGGEVTFKTDGELANALREVERRLASAQGRRVGIVYIQSSNTLYHDASTGGLTLTSTATTPRSVTPRSPPGLVP